MRTVIQNNGFSRESYVVEIDGKIDQRMEFLLRH
jgi:hypothetical protein